MHKVLKRVIDVGYLKTFQMRNQMFNRVRRNIEYLSSEEGRIECMCASYSRTWKLKNEIISADVDENRINCVSCSGDFLLLLEFNHLPTRLTRS